LSYQADDRRRTDYHTRYFQRIIHLNSGSVNSLSLSLSLLGNGNLDTQSFFHSQEVNVLIDSALVCQEWLKIINRNQNTAKYGAASVEDGCWHDPETGEIPPGSVGIDPGRFSWARGIVGAVKRVRGVGGF
jgi:hypothetical protein